MSYGLQLLGNARSVRGDQFRRPEFDRQRRGSVQIVGHSEPAFSRKDLARRGDVYQSSELLAHVAVFDSGFTYNPYMRTRRRCALKIMRRKESVNGRN
jgi:hypothetical protein